MSTTATLEKIEATAMCLGVSTVHARLSMKLDEELGRFHGVGWLDFRLLQLLAKDGDLFTGGREYYSHPNYRGSDKPGIIHQSSATGMQAIPTTGIAQGIQFLEKIQSAQLKKGPHGEPPVVVCSLGDASVTEGEVSEAFQFAELCADLGVRLLDLSAGSPYYNPHIQRPAAYPPSDGYQPPEDPLIGVARQLAAEAQREADQRYRAYAELAARPAAPKPE